MLFELLYLETGLLVGCQALRLRRFELLGSAVLYLISGSLLGLLLHIYGEGFFALLQLLDSGLRRINLEGYGLRTCVIVLQGNLNGVLSNILSALSV